MTERERAPDAPREAAPVPPRRRFADVSGPELVVVGLAALLTIAYAPSTYSGYFTAKAAVLLGLLGPGLLVLGLAAARRDRAAWCAGGFVAVAALSTAFSDNPVMSLTGGFKIGNGWLFVAALAGAWALGRMLGPGARRLVVLAILVGASVNAAFGCAQMVVDLGPAWTQPFQGRALALMSNPVQLGALCAGALWLIGDRLRTSSRVVAWCALATLMAAAVEFSGSRIALAAGIAATLWLAYRAGRARGLALIGAVAVGIVLAVAVPTRAVDTGTNRIASDASVGVGPRVGSWREALDALGERPLLGYGPGRYFVATAPRTSLAVARYGGGDLLYADAHNFVVEELTTTGVLGLLLFAAWIVLALRRARGPLLGFVGVVAVTMLLEPQFIGLTPLVALALGAAGSALPPSRRTRATPLGRVALLAAGLLAAVGLGAGLLLVVGDRELSSAVHQLSVPALRRADADFPPWPEIPAARGRLDLLAAAPGHGPAAVDRAEASQRAAIRRDPADPKWWYELGQLLEQFRGGKGAATAYHAALRRNPWSAAAMQGLYRLARDRGDFTTARHWRERVCRLGSAACIPASDLARAEARN